MITPSSSGVEPVALAHIDTGVPDGHLVIARRRSPILAVVVAVIGVPFHRHSQS